MKVNIKTISKMTGVSPATVSNALNNRKGVSRETAERIQAVAREFGYFDGARIETINFVIYKRDGKIVTDTPFFTALIAGVEAEARAAGYKTVICNLDYREPDFFAVRDQILNDSSSAILLLATEMQEEDIKPFSSSLAPIVVLDSWFEDMTFDSVLISNTDSVCSAVRGLIARGHKKIGYLCGSTRIKNFFYREEGYMRAMAGAGLEADPKFCFPLTPDMEGAYADMLFLLENGIEMPTAFFADNDMVALGAMRAFREYGYAVPDDISVVGFDDLPFGAVSYPPLSTIQVPKEEMGRTAVRRLIEIIRNPAGVKMKIQVCNTYIERGSVRYLNDGEAGGVPVQTAADRAE